MAEFGVAELIRRLRRGVESSAEAPGDGELLRRFAERRDEAAFTRLVERHGVMVLGVCRRVLGDGPDAEDAWQAVFLVLARRADSAGRRGSVGGWLHTVALRVALDARRRRVGRADPDAVTRAADPRPGPASAAADGELRAVLDEEVNRLPERYRVPFVLCQLEGRSNAEAARALGRPVGTVESWLTRARQRLRDRLTRRGLAPASVPVGIDAAAATAGRHPAPVWAVGGPGGIPPQIQTLAEGVLRTMRWTRVKLTAAVLAAALLTLGAGGLALRSTLARPVAPSLPAPAGAGAGQPAAPDGDLLATLKRLETETWEAFKKRDETGWERLSTPNWTGVFSDGTRVTQDTAGEYLKKIRITDYKLSDLAAQPLTPDVAVLTYRARCRGSFDGEPFEERGLVISSVWVKRDGHWRNALYQETLGTK